MHGAITTSISGLTAAGIMASNVVEERAAARRNLESHDFYYLYRADQALDSLN